MLSVVVTLWLFILLPAIGCLSPLFTHSIRISPISTFQISSRTSRKSSFNFPSITSSAPWYSLHFGVNYTGPQFTVSVFISTFYVLHGNLLGARSCLLYLNFIFPIAPGPCLELDLSKKKEDLWHEVNDCRELPEFKKKKRKWVIWRSMGMAPFYSDCHAPYCGQGIPRAIFSFASLSASPRQDHLGWLHGNSWLYENKLPLRLNTERLEEDRAWLQEGRMERAWRQLISPVIREHRWENWSRVF